MQKWLIAAVVLVVVVAVVLFVNNSTSSGANATSISVRAPAQLPKNTVDATLPAQAKAKTLAEGLGLRSAQPVDVEAVLGQNKLDVDEFFAETQ